MYVHMYICNGILFRLKEGGDSDTCYIIWVKLENIMLGERSQSQKDTNCMIPLTEGI